MISCSNQKKVGLILIGNWRIVETIDQDKNQKVPDQGVTFTFNSDKTWTSVSEATNIKASGKWTFETDTLNLINNSDTTIFKIEYLSDSELSWKANMHGINLKFKVKKE
jgi:hypothetical protein